MEQNKGVLTSRDVKIPAVVVRDSMLLCVGLCSFVLFIQVWTLWLRFHEVTLAWKIKSLQLPVVHETLSASSISLLLRIYNCINIQFLIIMHLRDHSVITQIYSSPLHNYRNEYASYMPAIITMIWMILQNMDNTWKIERADIMREIKQQGLFNEKLTCFQKEMTFRSSAGSWLSHIWISGAVSAHIPCNHKSNTNSDWKKWENTSQKLITFSITLTLWKAARSPWK